MNTQWIGNPSSIVYWIPSTFHSPVNTNLINKYKLVAHKFEYKAIRQRRKCTGNENITLDLLFKHDISLVLCSLLASRSIFFFFTFTFSLEIIHRICLVNLWYNIKCIMICFSPSDQTIYMQNTLKIGIRNFKTDNVKKCYGP